MNHFFSLDGPLYRWMSLLWQLLILNFLLIVTSLPLFTIGASQAAGFSVAIKIINREAVAIVPSFFRAFRKNLKQGTLFFLAGLFFGGMLLVNWRYFQIAQGFSIWLVVGWVIVAFIFGNVLQYSFFYMARYEESVKTILVNIVKITVKYPMRSTGLLALWLLPLFLMIASPYFFIFGLYMGLVFGTALLLFIRSYLLVRFFKKIAEQTNLQEKKLTS
ncbi:DUF624 domain-containing protein [Enterococcus sp. LJL90]